jgi:Tfp pilus assembly protein PilN
LGVVLLGLAAQQAYAARSALERARSQVSEQRQVLSDLKERERRAAGRREGSVTTARALAASHSPPSRVLGDLVALLPPGVRLNSIGLTYGEGVEVDLQVVARQSRDYDQFMERLARTGRFEAVRPGAERREGELRVDIRMTYRPDHEP